MSQGHHFFLGSWDVFLLPNFGSRHPRRDRRSIAKPSKFPGRWVVPLWFRRSISSWSSQTTPAQKKKQRKLHWWFQPNPSERYELLVKLDHFPSSWGDIVFFNKSHRLENHNESGPNQLWNDANQQKSWRYRTVRLGFFNGTVPCTDSTPGGCCFVFFPGKWCPRKRVVNASELVGGWKCQWNFTILNNYELRWFRNHRGFKGYSNQTCNISTTNHGIGWVLVSAHV